MFDIKGQLLKIVPVAEKIAETYTTKAHQLLQVLAENPSSGKLELMDIKDKEMVYKKEMVGKEITVPCRPFSSSDIYWSVAN